MSKNCLLALDIGGTKINAGLISLSGRIIIRQRNKTQTQKNKATILKNIFKTIDNLLAWAKIHKLKILAIGLGIAGQVDPERGIFRAGANFPSHFRNIPLKKILEKKYSYPVSLDNDARLFTLGEAYFGQGKKYKNIIGLTLGTGIGGGIIIDKKIYRGKDGVAGEFGHFTLKANNSNCSCGKKGHFEALASGRAISNLYKNLTGQKLSAKKIEEKMKQGEKTAKIAVEQASQNLALGLANLINTLNPEIIILGGGLIRFKNFWQLAFKLLKKEKIYPFNLKTKVVVSRLGDDANLLGAAFFTGKLRGLDNSTISNLK